MEMIILKEVYTHWSLGTGAWPAVQVGHTGKTRVRRQWEREQSWATAFIVISMGKARQDRISRVRVD